MLKYYELYMDNDICNGCNDNICILCTKINPPFLLRFDDEVKNNKIISSRDTFEIIIESTMCPNNGSKSIIVLNPSIEY